MRKLSRRDFLKLSGVAGTTLIGGYALSQMPGVIQGNNATVVRPATSNFNPDVDIRLRAQAETVPLLSGQPTDVWRYTGDVISGDASHLVANPDSYLGPTIRVRTGQKVRIRFQNELPEASNVHWHGLYVPDYADGHPRFVAQSGEEYVYEFEVINRAGTYWYHPHPHARTGAQVNAGLAGLFIVEDDIEQELALPSGEYDVPLVIQDRRFDDTNQLMYVNNMHDRMMGFWGDTVLVNGQVNPAMPVSNRSYRLRLLNGSNSRIYILAWDDQRPVHVIGTDGGLLERTVSKPYITLGPAERAELWVEFSYFAGSQRQLVDLGTGRAIPIASFDVDNSGGIVSTPPSSLRDQTMLDPLDAVNSDNPRIFEFMMSQRPTINQQSFQMDIVGQDEIVQLGDTEIWEFRNLPQGGMMPMPHPIHMHGHQFQVISRSIDPMFEQQWSSITAGYLDYGWKDTVLLLPGETVRVIVKFDTYPGLFVYHCHTLEHEDLGMMRNYEVRA